MGATGRTGLSHLPLGCVTERVLGTAPCPVLTIRASRGEAARDVRRESGAVPA